MQVADSSQNNLAVGKVVDQTLLSWSTYPCYCIVYPYAVYEADPCDSFVQLAVSLIEHPPWHSQAVDYRLVAFVLSFSCL